VLKRTLAVIRAVSTEVAPGTTEAGNTRATIMATAARTGMTGGSPVSTVGTGTTTAPMAATSPTATGVTTAGTTTVANIEVTSPREQERAGLRTGPLRLSRGQVMAGRPPSR